MCDKCYIDEVSIEDIPTCLLQSVSDIFHDISQGQLNLQSFVINDRIFYIILVFIIVMIIRYILKGNKNQKTDQTFWEMDTRWNP